MKKKNNSHQKQNPFFSIVQSVFNSISTEISRRKESVVSNLRFSISLRISLTYFRFLLTSLVAIIVIYSLALMVIVFPILHRDDKILANEVINTFEEGSMSQQWLNQLKRVTQKDIYVAIDEVMYTTSEALNLANRNRIYYDRTNNELFYIHFINENNTIIVAHSLNDKLRYLRNIILFVAILEILRMIKILLKGNKAHKKVLKPIKDITETAEIISAQNLGERINVVGTKNELKDLAKTINIMMDRIESSYNSQQEFVSDASHELRTPIAVIQGYANLLNRWGKKDKDVLEESILAIKNETDHMQDLVEKLLFLARHDKKTLKLDKSFFELKPMLEEMIKETKMLTQNHSIESTIDCTPIIYGDKQGIKQAIRVFVDNAIKYTQEDGKIMINCTRVKEECIIEIVDNGVGISKKDLKKVFNRFYRVDASRKINKTGHGLGLAIARLIIVGHNGKIKVKSKLGEGSTFSIHLKVEKWT
ncbi:signal transduction histidine kinase [Natranaerovirga hydrolytica]|uniref:histidine kinase n=1 Tax=Natranaerovirga hydrolytica TaxID=680378 RepID=A0A4R1N624_9FIRM|nr:HAMP domain-containing sensor histidine kinase [Natranaerovirga hydrolytica]TCK98469.1 signal transduction histidine kinase [Natranaerovirga hydrolytica]